MKQYVCSRCGEKVKDGRVHVCARCGSALCARCADQGCSCPGDVRLAQ